MTRINTLLLLILSTIATSANAEWHFFTKTNESHHFIDPETIRREGNVVKVWTMIDFDAIQPSGGRSVKIQYLVDCREETTAMKTAAEYSLQRGIGQILTSGTFPDNRLEWKSVIPGSIAEDLAKRVCTTSK